MAENPLNGTTPEEWATIAAKVRSGRMYICFEEPEDPMVYRTEFDNSGELNPRWEKTSWDADWCEESHPGLGCGLYRIALEEM